MTKRLTFANVASGFVATEVGLRLRYEITRDLPLILGSITSANGPTVGASPSIMEKKTKSFPCMLG